MDRRHCIARRARCPVPGRVQDRVQAARLREPGSHRPARGARRQRTHRLLRAGRLPREQGVDDPAVRQRDGAVLRRYRERASRTSRSSARTTPQNAHQISDDGTIAYAEINFVGPRATRSTSTTPTSSRTSASEIDVEGLQVELGGFIFADAAGLLQRARRHRAPPSSSCSSPSDRCSRWGCRSSPRCSASVRAPRSSAS